jgi:predicted cupin superfamily sugar epimerase
MALSVDQVIALLGLRPLEGEGGYFVESYRTDWSLAPASMPGDFPDQRLAATAIYFLVTPGQFSAMHRLRGDELWHFYLGDPVDLVVLSPDGAAETIRMGQDLLAGERLQALAPGGTWFGCGLAPGGNWALLGTTMTPGFHPEDFELADRALLLEQYPEAADSILNLTRVSPDS